MFLIFVLLNNSFKFHIGIFSFRIRLNFNFVKMISGFFILQRCYPSLTFKLKERVNRKNHFIHPFNAIRNRIGHYYYYRIDIRNPTHRVLKFEIIRAFIIHNSFHHRSFNFINIHFHPPLCTTFCF